MFYNIVVIDSETGEVVTERRHEGFSNIVSLDIVLWYLDRYRINCNVIVTPINEVTNTWE
jgi:hypothetical protein